jgi:AcrR family transcriptional regulator
MTADPTPPPSPAPLPLRERQRQLTNAAILDAAFDLFRELGMRPTTVDQIATRAGVSRATFYLHFKDKKEVAAALSRRMVDIGQSHYRELGAMPDPSLADIRGWLDRHVTFLRKHRILSLTLVEAISTEPAFAQEYLDYLGRIADLRMDAALSRAAPERRDLLRSKLVLLHLTMTYSMHHLIGQELQFPGTDPMDALAALWWDALRAQ